MILKEIMNIKLKLIRMKLYCSYPSHFLNSIESGGFISTFSLPTSFQLVDRTVPLLSWKDFIIARWVSALALA